MSWPLTLLLSFFLTNCTWADQVQVAVAANFAAPMKQIAVAFEQTTGHKVSLSFGATGKFYSQIKNAAPFDLLLAADQTVPIQLEHDNAAVIDTRFTYAIGKLVLWSAKPDLVDNQGAILNQGGFNHLAIAAPTQAPYGRAAKETLVALDLFVELSPKLVQGESVGQTYSFIATGNAELGFIALSQALENNQAKVGSMWVVPTHLYTPLLQDAILLKHGQHNSAALALLDYLKSDQVRQIVRTYGYD